MSNLTNDIRRVRAKIKVLETEGSYQVMMDLMDETVMDYTQSEEVLGTPWRKKVIDRLKAKYVSELTELEEKQGKFKQGKFNL